MGGIAALLQWAVSTSSESLLEAVAMALCNMSTSPQNQVEIGKVGLLQLLNLARTVVDSMPTVWNYIAGCLRNVSLHEKNRTPFYIAELTAKRLDAKNRLSVMIPKPRESTYTSANDQDTALSKSTAFKRRESASRSTKKREYMHWLNTR